MHASARPCNLSSARAHVLADMFLVFSLQVPDSGDQTPGVACTLQPTGLSRKMSGFIYHIIKRIEVCGRPPLVIAFSFNNVGVQIRATFHQEGRKIG